MTEAGNITTAALKAEEAKQKQVNDFRKAAPHFRLGEITWATFMDGFQEVQFTHPLVDEISAKNVLYTSLKGQAFVLASPDYNPRMNPVCAAMSFNDYATHVGELFEPAAEAEQTKLEFETRVQRPGEHPNLYFRDKKNLFYRAYSEPMRDYNFFYNKVISGLTNQEMRNGMRLFDPTPLNNHEAFRKRLMQMATIVRRKYLDGELTEAEALGAEAHVAVASYQNYPSTQGTSLGNSITIKNEPINAIGGQPATKRTGKCYHCSSKDHFIAQCPRKAAGLPQTVQSVAPQGIEEEEPVNALYNGPRNGPANRKTYYDARTGSRFSSFGNRTNYQDQKRKTFQKSNNNSQKYHNRRIAVVYETEDGQLVAEDSDLYEIEDDSEPQPITEETETAEGINALHLKAEEDFSESSFVPGSFLGM